MVLATLAIRKLFHAKLPGNAFLILWLAAALRFLLPVAVPVPWNAYTVLEHFGVLAEWDNTFGMMGAKEPILEGRQEVQASGGQNPAGNYAMEEGKGDARAQEGAAGLWGVLSLWSLIYLAGALLCGAFYAFAYLKCCWEFRAALPVEDLAALEYVQSFPVRRKVQVRQSGLVATPITYGVLHPVILLPKGIQWESGRQMQLVLTHELVHIRRFDVVWKLLFSMAVCIHWCNPLAWVMRVLANRDIELACDEKVVQYFGRESRSVYAMSLLSLAERKSGLMPWGAGFGKGAMEERIVAIMKKENYSVKAVAGAVVLVVFMVALFATSAKQTGEAYVAEGSFSEEGGQSSPIPIAAADVPIWRARSLEEEERRLIGFLENAYENGESEYQHFGLTYDNKENYFLYQGKVVGFFEDEMEPGMFRSFTDERGTIGLVAQRDASGVLAGFQEVSLQASSGGHSFYLEREPSGVAVAGNSGYATESAGDTAIDFPKEYENYGVSQDGKYKGKWIKVLYDAENFIYTSGCEGSPEAEVAYLLVQRDSKGKITSFQELTKKEMQNRIKKEGVEF